MPLYEYKCSECKKELTLMQKLNDLAPICPCREGAPLVMEKQISLSSFRLKGAGWYKTDYAGSKK